MTLFVLPLLHCLPPVLMPHWWCFISTQAYVLRCYVHTPICGVVCVRLFAVSTSVPALWLIDYGCVALISCYVYVLLVMLSGLVHLRCGALLLGVDLLCVSRVWHFCCFGPSMVLHFNHFMVTLISFLSFYDFFDDAWWTRWPLLWALPLLGPCYLFNAGLNDTAPVALESYTGHGHVTYLGISTGNALLEVMFY